MAVWVDEAMGETSRGSDPIKDLLDRVHLGLEDDSEKSKIVRGEW